MKAKRPGAAKRLAMMLAMTVGIQTVSAFVHESVQAEAANPPAINLEVQSAILIEAETGQVLFEMNADDPRPPASMAKMMTEYLVLDAIKEGKLSWDTPVAASKYAAKVGGSGSLIAEGEQFTVRKLFEDMSIYSGNRSSVALAEAVAGTEEAFAKKMNETARKMGLSDKANFVNATGLPRSMTDPLDPKSIPGETMLTARDAATLARRLLLDHPEVLEFTKIPQLKFRETDKTPMVNWNWMLEANASNINFKSYAYTGLDGLKTGHTEEAGYCFIGTAVRNGMRLISVVMGAKSEPKRFMETRKLLDYGFNNFEAKTLLEKGAVLDAAKTIPVTKGKKPELPVALGEPAVFAVRKGEQANPEIEVRPKPANELVAPIKKGDPVGTVVVKYNGAEKTIPLVAAEDLEKGSWFRLFFRSVKTFFGDLFSGISNGIKGLFG